MNINVLSIKDTAKNIKLIATTGKKLDERIHAVAVSALWHFMDNGDATLLSELCHAMPKSGRGNALKYWITKHAPVKWDKKAYAGKGGYVKAGDIPENWKAVVEEAHEHPFYEKEDTERATFIDPLAQAKSLLTRIQAAIEQNKIKEGVDTNKVIELQAKLAEVLA